MKHHNHSIDHIGKKLDGSILITALLIMSISVMVIASIVTTEQRLILNTTIITHNDQLYSYLQGVQQWAVMNLASNNTSGNISENDQIFKKKIKQTLIKGILYPQDGLFNINLLKKRGYATRFQTLLAYLLPEIQNEKRHQITALITQWLKIQHGSKERLFTCLSELRLINEITPSIYNKISPYLTALPLHQYNKDNLYRIDINHTTIPVLLTLNQHMNIRTAENIVHCIQQHGNFTDLKTFIQLCHATQAINPSTITTNSQFYLLKASASNLSHHVTIESLFQSEPNTKKIRKHNTVKLIWQQINTKQVI